MKPRIRQQMAPIHVREGDSLHLTYVETDPETGEEIRREVVQEDAIGRSMTLDGAVIFDVEPGEFGDDVTDGIGGAFLQTKKEEQE